MTWPRSHRLAPNPELLDVPAPPSGAPCGWSLVSVVVQEELAPHCSPWLLALHEFGTAIT